MKVFNEDTQCVKCGKEKADSLYISDVNAGNFGYPHAVILRTCKRCGHIWAELPLDSQ